MLASLRPAPDMTQQPHPTDKANKLARAWLAFVSLLAATLTASSLVGYMNFPLWLTVALGSLALVAAALAMFAPPSIRRAFAEFLAWPWT
jgi:hypothetical protein